MKLAAGVTPYCQKTGRFLFAKRGPNINNPNVWGNFGGKAEMNETPKQCAIREFREESGYTGDVKLSSGYPQKNSDGFVFVNYIGIVPSEFTPSTIGQPTVDGDVEVAASKWLTIDEIRKILGKPFVHTEYNRFLTKLCENTTDSIEPIMVRKRTINEIAYNDYKNDSSKTERQKINLSIKEISARLRQVEQMVNHASKLKSETGQDQTVFWKGTANSVVKIKERLNRLMNKIVEITG